MKHWAKTIALWLLRGYQWAISPLLLPACRYTPTCSEYAMEAIDRFGVLRGTAKAAARLSRCHPFSKGGYDPVMGGFELGGGEADGCASSLTHS